ncbi:potassium channel family protein [Agarivorans albus]
MVEKGNTIYKIFMLTMSVYILCALTLEMFIVEDDEIKSVLRYIDLVVCFFFLLDFFVNLFSAESKSKYLKWGWIDLVASIPTLDTLRWGRVAKVIRIVRFLRSLKSIKEIYRAVKDSRIQSITVFVFLTSFLSFTVCSSLILHFEREVNADLNTASDALWWAFLNIMNAKISVTLALTNAGQVMTLLLNKIGLLLFAYFNGIIISWLVNKRVEFKESSAS